MTRGVIDNPALDAWAAKATQPCLLPSGTWAKVRPPDPEILIRGGMLPDELLDVARSYVAKGAPDTDNVGTEELLRYIALSREMAARCVVAIGEGENGPWRDQELTANDLDVVPPDDIDALRAIAFRQTTAAIMTARTKLALNAIDQSEAASVEQREAGATVDGQRDFRAEQPSDEPGADGADVQPATVSDGGNRRSRGRARG